MIESDVLGISSAAKQNVWNQMCSFLLSYMCAMIVYELPNRANCPHNICSSMFRVKPGPLFFDILFYFGFNENISGGFQPLLLITIENCVCINCVL